MTYLEVSAANNSGFTLLLTYNKSKSCFVLHVHNSVSNLTSIV